MSLFPMSILPASRSVVEPIRDEFADELRRYPVDSKPAEITGI
jgi:hypothetical protein